MRVLSFSVLLAIYFSGKRFKGKEFYPPNLLTTFIFPKILANLISYQKRHFSSLRKQKALNFPMLQKSEATFYVGNLLLLI